MSTVGKNFSVIMQRGEISRRLENSLASYPKEVSINIRGYWDGTACSNVQDRHLGQVVAEALIG